MHTIHTSQAPTSGPAPTMLASDHVAQKTGGNDAGQLTPSSARPTSSAKLSTAGILRSERIKFTSLRSIRLTLLITVLASIGISVLVAWSASDLLVDGLGTNDFLLMVSTFPSSFLALIFGVLGVFAIASEYSSGMILSTLTAVPGRTPVFVAKGAVLATLAGAMALVLTLSALFIAVAFAPAAAAALTETQVVTGVLGAVAYLVLIALFAFGISTVLRSTAGGIAVVVGITFVLPVALQVLSMFGWDWVLTVLNYLPASLGNVLASGLTDPVPGATGPDFWQALVVMVLWAIATLVPGYLVFRRRDAK